MAQQKVTRSQAMDILNISAEELEVYPKAFKAKRNGTFTVCESFFYTHGRSPLTVFEALSDKARAKGFKIEALNLETHKNPWPRDSYFEVTFQFIEEAD